MVLRNKNAYPRICLDLLSYMEEKWQDYLTYHTISHIIDVANVCENYIAHYKIDAEIADLIRIAAISHDIGYIISPNDHEELGIIEIKPFLTPLYSAEQIAVINGMIRATKVPQTPSNLYEQILADADLDYLGRADYDELSEGLFREFRHFNLISNKLDWLDTQINFIENHNFHTTLAIETRRVPKLQKLEELKQKRLKMGLKE